MQHRHVIPKITLARLKKILAPNYILKLVIIFLLLLLPLLIAFTRYYYSSANQGQSMPPEINPETTVSHAPKTQQPSSVQNLTAASGGSPKTESSQTQYTSSQGTAANPTPTTHTDINSYLSSTTPPAPSCNVELKVSYGSQKEANLAYENSIHNSFHSTAPFDSSYYGIQMDQENARHTAALAVIEANYRSNLIMINCQ